MTNMLLTCKHALLVMTSDLKQEQLKTEQQSADERQKEKLAADLTSYEDTLKKL